MCGVAVGRYRYSVEPAQQGQEVTHSAVCSTHNSILNHFSFLPFLLKLSSRVHVTLVATYWK